MGRNGPEHRPGSETPRPLLRSERRAGRKSVTLTPPHPQRFPCRSPLPSACTPQGGGGRAYRARGNSALRALGGVARGKVLWA
jgi:hypothetical protein